MSSLEELEAPMDQCERGMEGATLRWKRAVQDLDRIHGGE